MTDGETITNERAKEAAQRLINSHFRKKPSARASIPVDLERDDDVVLMRYLDQAQIDHNLAVLLKTERTPATKTMKEVVAHWFAGIPLWGHAGDGECVLCSIGAASETRDVSDD